MGSVFYLDNQVLPVQYEFWVKADMSWLKC